jgi:hypothetical protein
MTTHGDDSASRRTTGAVPVGEKPAGRKWLLPLLLGLLLLIALLFLLSRCGGDDDSAQPGAGVSPSAAAPSAATTTSAAALPSTAAGAGQPGAGQQGTLVAGGANLLGAGGAANLSAHAGEQATGTAVQVQSVPADEGFWAGTSASDRVWVQLTNTNGESAYKVKEGDLVNFTGTVTRAAAGFAAKAGVTAAEGADQLTEQGHYVSVAASAVKLSS